MFYTPKIFQDLRSKGLSSSQLWTDDGIGVRMTGHVEIQSYYLMQTILIIYLLFRTFAILNLVVALPIFLDTYQKCVSLMTSRIKHSRANL